jgi:iron(III) transport system substrate-binding protein
VHTSDAGHFVYFKAQKLLTKYTPAGVEAFPAGFKDKDGYFYGLRATVNVIAYNTKAVSAAEAPKTWKDLLDPRWKGKMVTAHPGYSGVISTHVLALVNQYGWDYFKQLAQNKLMLVQSAVDPSGVVASGERPVAVDGGEYTFYQIKKKGNPVEIVYPKEGVPLVVSPSAIMSFAPHPTAAKLFTDFTFSREIQQVMADSEGLYTGHPEVKYPADKPKLTDLKLLTVDPEELEKRGEEIRQRGGEFGTTTGRPRRCGWLDLVALRYAARINGLTALALTKLDVLSGFDRVKVAMRYRGAEEAEFETFPYHQSVLHHARGVYEELPGWSEDIGEARTESDLPQAARDYLRFIEEHIGVPIALVGVGPGREQVVWSDGAATGPLPLPASAVVAPAQAR